MIPSLNRGYLRQLTPTRIALMAAVALRLTACSGDDGGGGEGGAGGKAGSTHHGGMAGTTAGGAGGHAGHGEPAGGHAGAVNCGGGNAGNAGSGDQAGSDNLGGAGGSQAGAGGVGGDAGATGAPLAIGGDKLASARYAMDYSGRITASGGSRGGYSFAISSGSLPPGIALSAAGVLSGRPAAEGDFTFEVMVSDSAQATAVAAFSLAVGRHRWLTYQYEERHSTQEGETESLSVLMADTSVSGFPVQAGSFALSEDGGWLRSGDTINDISGSTVGPPITIAAAQVRWSPHAEWIVVQAGSGFAVLRPSNPTQLIPFEARSNCTNFRWSPNDSRVAYECDGVVQVFEADAPPNPVASREVAPGTLIGWGADDLLTFATTAGKLGAATFGALSGPAKELDLAAEALSISATAPLLHRVVFRDASLSQDVLVDFNADRILSEANLIYSPGLTRFARWESGGITLSVYAVSDPDGAALVSVPALGFSGWSADDEVLATSGAPDNQMRFTWVSSAATKFVPGATGTASFGPGADWVFVGSSLAFLNQADPQLVTFSPTMISEQPTLAPNHERFAYYTYGGACVVDVTSAGLGASACTVQANTEASWPLLWSTDSTTLAFRTVGYEATWIGGPPTGLWVVDAQNASNNAAVVEGFSGISLFTSLGDTFAFQP